MLTGLHGGGGVASMRCSARSTLLVLLDQVSDTLRASKVCTKEYIGLIEGGTLAEKNELWMKIMEAVFGFGRTEP